MSDHFVREAIYLTDPDGHGIEIYGDRPRESGRARWLRMATEPLDVEGLPGVLDDPATAEWEGLPAGTTWVTPISRWRHRRRAGASIATCSASKLMVKLPAQAAFFCAGGYHHHIGANTWNSRGSVRRRRAPPPWGGRRSCSRCGRARPCRRAVGLPAGSRRRHSDGVQVRDPAGIALLLAAAP